MVKWLNARGIMILIRWKQVNREVRSSNPADIIYQFSIFHVISYVTKLQSIYHHTIQYFSVKLELSKLVHECDLCDYFFYLDTGCSESTITTNLSCHYNLSIFMNNFGDNTAIASTKFSKLVEVLL